MYTGLDFVADILSFSDTTGGLKVHRLEKMLDRYSSQIPKCLYELERYHLIGFDPYYEEMKVTFKGAEFLNLYNDLKELISITHSTGL